MLGAAPIGQRAALLVAVAAAALAAVPATTHAESGAVTARTDGRPGMWALEVTPEFARSVEPRLVARARQRGINTIVLTPKLSLPQKHRVRSVARRFGLPVIKLRRRACNHPVRSCTVLARKPAAVGKLLRRRHVDIVVLRLSGPTSVRRLAQKHAQVAQRRSSARLLLMPRVRPRLYPGAWREAISAVSDLRRVGLGVRPSVRSGRRALNAFLDLLHSSPSTPDPTPPPPAPAPAPSPPSDRIEFTGDFETGDISQWTWGAQCANTGVPSSGSLIRGTISVQSEIVAQGTYGARFQLPAAAGTTACEALAKRQVGVGTDDYYGFMVRFPADWREPSSAGWGLSLAQLNFQNIWGAPVSLNAHADHVALVMQSGRCNSVETSKPVCNYSSGRNGNVAPMVAVPAPLVLEEWHELIVHVRWATDSSGIIEAWHRLKGDEAWNKTVSVSGYPTVQWTDEERPDTIAGNSSDKIGAYRGGADFPLTIWHDGFVRTTTFAAASAAFS